MIGLEDEGGGIRSSHRCVVDRQAPSHKAKGELEPRWVIEGQPVLLMQ